jgi:hypothetical protein
VDLGVPLTPLSTTLEKLLPVQPATVNRT